MGLALFFVLAAVCVGSVVAMIVTRNQAYAALFLVVAFAGLGGLFGLLDAPFVAAAQVLIYAGAIMVLFLFVIMMIDRERGAGREKRTATVVLASALGVVLLAELLLAARGALGALGRPARELIGRPAALGRLLFTEYLYPFEITSILIVAALVGAIVLVKKEKGGA